MFKRKIGVLVLLFSFLLTSLAFAGRPSVTADESYFDPDVGQYILTGNVRIEIGSRLITASAARFSPVTMEVWGDNGAELYQGDIYFSGGSIYVNGPQRTAYISGGTYFKRDGLAISSDSASFNWSTKLAAFDGNVVINQNGNEWYTGYQEYNVRENTFQ